MLISDNRRSVAGGDIGSRSWWQKKDLLTHPKVLTCASIAFLCKRLTYFLCHNDNYIKSTTMEIEEAALVQQLTLTQVFYTLAKIKMLVSGPDGFPFWV